MYWYSTGIAEIDKVVSGFLKQGTTIIILIQMCRGLCRIHRFYGEWDVNRC